VEHVQQMAHNARRSCCNAADRDRNRLRGTHAAPVASFSLLGFGRSVLCYRPFATYDTSMVKVLLPPCQGLWLCYSSPRSTHSLAERLREWWALRAL
jgi:hypothetical protein